MEFRVGEITMIRMHAIFVARSQNDERVYMCTHFMYTHIHILYIYMYKYNATPGRYYATKRNVLCDRRKPSQAPLSSRVITARASLVFRKAPVELD